MKILIRRGEGESNTILSCIKLCVVWSDKYVTQDPEWSRRDIKTNKATQTDLRPGLWYLAQQSNQCTNLGNQAKWSIQESQRSVGATAGKCTIRGLWVKMEVVLTAQSGGCESRWRLSLLRLRHHSAHNIVVDNLYVNDTDWAFREMLSSHSIVVTPSMYYYASPNLVTMEKTVWNLNYSETTSADHE